MENSQRNLITTYTKRLGLFLALFLLVLSSTKGAVANNSTNQTTYFPEIPDIEVKSADFNDSVGVNSSDKSRLSWIIILSTVFLAVFIYSFDIDPRYILVIIAMISSIMFLITLGVV